MKKVSLVIVSLLLIIPFTVKAASPSVSTLEATSTDTTIKYNGMMEDGSYAVMCKLYNDNNEEIDLLSSAVDNNAFSGSFSDVAEGVYNVVCANYDGGETKKVAVTVNKAVNSDNNNTVSDNKTTTKSSNNVKANPPKTLDDIMLYISLFGISLVGLICIGIFTKKKLLNK